MSSPKIHYWTGCSGWQYPEWQGKFYPKNLPKTRWFQFYAHEFNTVEMNYTFYHFPSVSSLKRWYENSPEGFRYSLKANRSITHFHRFHDTEKIITDFYKLSDLLAEKLGYILFQLPKKIIYNRDYLEKITRQLSKEKLNVLEFQDESWWREDVVDFLQKEKIVFANINSPIIHQPLLSTGDIYYIRLHGQEEWYQGFYTKNFLTKWFNTIEKNHPKEVWFYFDNTADSAAIKDALMWRELTEKTKE